MESLNKIYGTSIIVSEFVYAKVKDRFKFRFLDKVAVKGKKQGVYIYELLAEVGVTPDLELARYNQEFRQAFSFYEQGQWQSALNLFHTLADSYPDDLVIKLLISRCAGFIVNPPSEWHGIWVMAEK